MNRYSKWIVSVGLAMILAVVAFACGEPEAPPPECQIDTDCGPNKYCEAGKCLILKTPEQIAQENLDRAAVLLKESKIDYPAVIEAYKAALREVPNIQGVDFNIGLCYMKMREFDKALPIFSKAYEANPNDVNAVLALGRVEELKNNLSGALDVYQKFIESNPDNLEVRTNVATIYRVKGEKEKAMEQVRTIFVKDPAHPGAFNNLGLIYLSEGKLLLARMVTVNGIEAQKNVKKVEDAGLYNNLGLIYLKMGDDVRAVANFRIAYSLDNKMISVNHNLGNTYLKSYDFTRAIEHYHHILSEDPYHYGALVGVAQCLRGLAKFEESKAAYEKVLQLYPNDAVSTFNLGVLYFDHLKQQEPAHASFRKFLTMGYNDPKKRELAEMYLSQEVIIQEPEPEEQEMNLQKAESSEETSDDAAEAAAAEGAAPAEETPAEETAPAPAEEKPAEEAAPAPAEEKPAEETAPAPAEEKPAEEAAPAPAEEKPAEEAAPAPAEEKPAEEAAPAPAEEKPAESAAQ